MKDSPHAPHSARPELSIRIATSLGLAGGTLNEVDIDDLSVSDTVMETLEDISANIISKNPEAEAGLKAYWIEKSDELVLCAASEGNLHLVRVPGSHWAVKPHTYH
ncbi:hypothetical protein [Fundidesulfovibrio soli]|uniref:hypothetical protein n=1 Tax=Fundidesulfovibrio soli TaxID=2922716 RepID=UPI001FAEB671|nr:hypothetical protein [Fundidesulfovibrio soli]